MFHDVSTLFKLYNMGAVCYNQIGTYGFEANREKESIHCYLSTLSSKPENWSFYVVALTSAKMRAARAARSFFSSFNQ